MKRISSTLNYLRISVSIPREILGDLNGIFTSYYALKKCSLLKIENNSSWDIFTHSNALAATHIKWKN